MCNCQHWSILVYGHKFANAPPELYCCGGQGFYSVLFFWRKTFCKKRSNLSLPTLYIFWIACYIKNIPSADINRKDLVLWKLSVLF